MSLPVQSQPMAASGLVIGGRVMYFGTNLRETAGAVAVVDIYDGTTSAGKLIDTFGLAADGADHDGPYSRGVLCEQGIYLDVNDGDVSCIVFYLPSWILDAQAVVDSSGSQRYVQQYFTQPDLYRVFSGEDL